jgi:hypothetical protein
MSDLMAPNPAMALAPPHTEEFLSLFRWVEAWIDGDLLLAEEGGPLLAEIAAAGQAHDTGDTAAVRRHTAGFLRAMEALIASRRLESEDGRPAITAARELLDNIETR